MERLFELLKNGGKILSQNSVSKIIWNEGILNDMVFVDNQGFGFIYIPDYKHEV